MMRFDILQKNRISFLKLYNSFKITPQKSLIFIPSFLESMILVAKIANININGIRGGLIIKGIFIIYVATFFVWVNDNSISLEKTMQKGIRPLTLFARFAMLISVHIASDFK